jgi:putative nucleotidyltransferase-like protein
MSQKRESRLHVTSLNDSQKDRGGRLKTSRGKLVAKLLAGAWRCAPPATSAEDLAEIANLVTACGAGGLAWCRLRDSHLRNSQVAELFQAQYRFQSLQGTLHERNLKRVIPALRAAGVEPLLVKGWAIARLYPELGMRPYIDLDICVLPKNYQCASDLLGSGEFDDCNVDLHSGFGKFYDGRTDDIFTHSRLVKLGDLDIRVLSPEDDLRFLCLHLLRHGAVQPLWLCDVALLLETRSDDFDWDRCLSGSRREADWVACAIGLAHRLLSVNLVGTPVARRAQNLPSWLPSTVLEEWGTRFKGLPQLAHYIRDPRLWLSDLPRELPSHWPNPIEATMTLKGPFNWLPRFPFQIGHVVSRAGALFSQLLGDLRGAIQHRS